jgi:hypothetical protein
VVSAKHPSDYAYAMTIPSSFELCPVPKSDDPWINSLIANLSRRGEIHNLAYTVWRRTNIVCTHNGEPTSASVYARDADDNRFLVWSSSCVWSHGRRPWLVSWDHQSVYETNSKATAFYLSPSGRYFVVIAPSGYGATYSKGRLSPRIPPLGIGEERTGMLDIQSAKWEHALRVDTEGIRSASWHSVRAE